MSWKVVLGGVGIGVVVVVFGVAPPGSDSETAFATLVEGLRMGDWGADRGWTPPTPAPPGNATGPVGDVRAAWSRGA
ncbi:MAG: hypothetical protein V5A44_09595 [Haloarculaceae archaeon]